MFLYGFLCVVVVVIVFVVERYGLLRGMDCCYHCCP